MQNILIVDDDACLRETLATFFTDEGFSVTTAGDGVSATEVLKRGQASLVVTDLHMPRMDGAELVAFVHANCAAMPVICISSDGAANAAAWSERDGVDVCLTKPLELGELLAHVQRLLAGR